jgi:hypothetical protein
LSRNYRKKQQHGSPVWEGRGAPASDLSRPNNSNDSRIRDGIVALKRGSYI